MPKILNFRHWGTKRARKHEAIKDLSIIGRGTFCAVYDKGDTVLKLTCDEMQYYYSTDYCRPQGRHFPRLIKDHGEIGEQGELGLYLFEVEKLKPVKRKLCSERTWKTYNNLIQKANSYYNPFVFTRGMSISDESRVVLEKLAEDKSFSAGLRDALNDVAYFIGNYGAISDMHRGNVMLRGQTIVLNDVVCDGEMLSAHRRRHW